MRCKGKYFMKTQLHQRKRSEASKSDEYETRCEQFVELCRKHHMHPQLDVAAKSTNTKCKWYLPKPFGLTNDWLAPRKKKVDIWCNPPNSLTQKFIEKAFEQYQKLKINIMLFIPIHATVTKNGIKRIWEDNRVELHPVHPTPKFLKGGKLQPEASRNRYCVALWYAKNWTRRK